MSEPLLLPALGESVTEGTVTRWLKTVGEAIAIDEPLVEVSTDKVDTEIPSPFEGILESILVREDQIATIGSVLAIIGTSNTAVADVAPAAEPASDLASGLHFPATSRPTAADGLSASLTSPTKMQDPSPVVEASNTSGYVTPLVRKLARQHGVDVSTVTGTGIGGRIRRSDVTAAAAASQPEPSAGVVPPAAASAPSSATLRGTTVKAPRIRSVIAARMRESLDTSTQLTQVHEVDVSAIVRLRARTKVSFAATNGVNLTYLPFIAQAVAEALKVHPMLNASFDESADTITYHDAEHLAFAVDSPKGLLVPVVRDAGTLSLAGLAAGIADVAARTRNGTIKADELSGGTFSITNIGSVGALFDTPIINSPQVGILGVGAIIKRPMVVADADGGDVLAIRHMMYLCLTYDHRLVDGADAGRFLQTVRSRMEAGAFEAELVL